MSGTVLGFDTQLNLWNLCSSQISVHIPFQKFQHIWRMSFFNIFDCSGRRKWQSSRRLCKLKAFAMYAGAPFWSKVSCVSGVFSGKRIGWAKIKDWHEWSASNVFKVDITLFFHPRGAHPPSGLPPWASPLNGLPAQKFSRQSKHMFLRYKAEEGACPPRPTWGALGYTFPYLIQPDESFWFHYFFH